MTIALGILTPFGAVLAADSEETTTYAGDLKSAVRKISSYHSIERRNGSTVFPSIAISGAGDSGYLEVIKQQIMDDFIGASISHPDEFDGLLRNRIKTFYKDHVKPFYAHADLNLRVELVIVAAVSGQRRMWKTVLNAVRNVDPIFGMGVVGVGERWTKMVLGPVVPVNDETSLAIAAAYGVFYAKEYAGGCGKQTQLIILRGHFPPLFANAAALESLDAAFRRFDGFHKSLRNSMLGVPMSDNFEGVEDRLRAIQESVGDIAANLYPHTSSQTQAQPNDDTGQPT